VIRFVLAEDSQQAFRFAPLSSDCFASQVNQDVRSRLPDSLVVQMANGDVYIRSEAVIQILSQLGGLWRGVALLLRFMPKPVRDWGYDWVGAHRHTFFSRPQQLCPLVPAELQSRFARDAA
jgi:predicted DCC family thiol-disulfide oxidoreductase YuxK